MLSRLLDAVPLGVDYGEGGENTDLWLMHVLPRHMMNRRLSVVYVVLGERIRHWPLSS